MAGGFWGSPWLFGPENTRPGKSNGTIENCGSKSMESETRLLGGENPADLEGTGSDQDPAYFVRPTFAVRIVNRLYAWITRIGFGLPNSYLLQVPGRKTGKTRSVAINVLSYNGKFFVVATRGSTHWSRNVLAHRKIVLKRGRMRSDFKVRLVLAAEKPKILKAYVTRFRQARRFFPVAAGSPSASFAPLADRHPVFELIRT
jgi:deazaflavin-dependent oxidoreductase (nitroreductase family)